MTFRMFQSSSSSNVFTEVRQYPGGNSETNSFKRIEGVSREVNWIRIGSKTLSETADSLRNVVRAEVRSQIQESPNYRSHSFELNLRKRDLPVSRNIRTHICVTLEEGCELLWESCIK